MTTALEKINPRHLGEKLRLARLAKGLRQEDAANPMGMARTTLVAIEKGERRVKARELAEFARLYDRPLSEFLDSGPAPEPLLPQFRLTAKDTGPDTNTLREAVMELEGLARDYLELEKLTRSPLPRRYPEPYALSAAGVTPEILAEEVAAAERSRLGLGDGPITDLRTLLEESVGLRIFYPKLPSELGGIYAYTAALGGCVAINRQHPPARAHWSLAHEYGHFLSTRDQADAHYWDDRPWAKSSAERFADAFARNFLMPRTGVGRMLTERAAAHGNGVTVADVLTLTHQFRVSAEAMFRRLEELKRLPVGTWDKLRLRKFQPDKARETLGLPPSRDREPLLPFRYRILAWQAFTAPDSTLSEAGFARFLRLDIVDARLALDDLRALSDQRGETGYESMDLPVGEVLAMS